MDANKLRKLAGIQLVEDTTQKQILKESLGFSGEIPTNKDYFSVYLHDISNVMSILPLISDIIEKFGYTHAWFGPEGELEDAASMLNLADESVFDNIILYAKRDLNDADVAKILKSMLAQGGDEAKTDGEIG